MLTMATIGADTGRTVVLIGLTAVDLRRLQEGQPIKPLKLGEMLPPEGERDVDNIDVVIFHATRAAIVELAEAVDTDPQVLFDALGEDL